MPAHILVVDDDAQQRSDMAEMVRSLGYRVTTAADGREALDRWPQRRPTRFLPIS